MKECFKCHVTKPLDEFYTHKGMTDGHLGKCKTCSKQDVRGNYAENRERYRERERLKYRLSIDRLILTKYYGIRRRSEEDYYHSHNHTVIGMPYLSKKQFMEWADENMGTFIKLYRKWAESGYSTKLAPSVDRIDNNLGYTKNNLQWLTHSENTSKYRKSLRRT